ncbi:hypothetical protein DVR09_16465 (plasmid) [Erythrobacter aureus]|uniref:Uncharacterized protein n=1 Tax=Erythrobacter aureus TaxID=2182384 RepID=A0A345YJE4_9SPHN|nr:hypothetical protein DVR09_16465 [Erythrobacter aureus]
MGRVELDLLLERCSHAICDLSPERWHNHVRRRLFGFETGLVGSAGRLQRLQLYRQLWSLERMLGWHAKPVFDLVHALGWNQRRDFELHEQRRSGFGKPVVWWCVRKLGYSRSG